MTHNKPCLSAPGCSVCERSFCGCRRWCNDRVQVRYRSERCCRNREVQR